VRRRRPTPHRRRPALRQSGSGASWILKVLVDPSIFVALTNELLHGVAAAIEGAASSEGANAMTPPPPGGQQCRKREDTNGRGHGRVRNSIPPSWSDGRATRPCADGPHGVGGVDPSARLPHLAPARWETRVVVGKRLTLGQIFTVAPPCMINATGAAH
jgi:hypothetical protein